MYKHPNGSTWKSAPFGAHGSFFSTALTSGLAPASKNSAAFIVGITGFEWQIKSFFETLEGIFGVKKKLRKWQNIEPMAYANTKAPISKLSSLMFFSPQKNATFFSSFPTALATGSMTLRPSPPGRELVTHGVPHGNAFNFRFFFLAHILRGP